MKKKILFIVLTFVLGMFVMPNVFAEESYGEVSSLVGPADFGDTNQTANVVVTYNTLNLEWSATDLGQGRFRDGWWIGFQVKAPVGFSQEDAQVRRANPDGTIGIRKFSQIKDGSDFFKAWLYVDNTVEDDTLFGTYEIDWDGNGNFEQKIQFKVKKEGLNLDKSKLTEAGGKSVIVTGANGKTGEFATTATHLSELGEFEQTILAQIIEPEEGKKFVGYKTEAGEEFDPETEELTDGLKLIAQYEDIPVEVEPTTPEDNGPDTADANIYGLLAIILVSGLGLLYVVRKRMN